MKTAKAQTLLRGVVASFSSKGESITKGRESGGKIVLETPGRLEDPPIGLPLYSPRILAL